MKISSLRDLFSTLSCDVRDLVMLIFWGCVLIFIGIEYCDLIRVFESAVLLFTGNIQEFLKPENTLLATPGILFSAAVLTFLPGQLIHQLIIVTEGEVKFDEKLREKTAGQELVWWILIGILEEVIYRWVPLGLIPRMISTGVMAQYALLLVFNIAFAWLHIFNYKAKDRRILRLIPHLVTGLMLSYTYLQFGFLVVASFHALWNTFAFLIHWRNGEFSN